MKKSWSKLLTIVLVAIMILSMLPLTALADTANDGIAEDTIGQSLEAENGPGEEENLPADAEDAALMQTSTEETDASMAPALSEEEAPAKSKNAMAGMDIHSADAGKGEKESLQGSSISTAESSGSFYFMAIAGDSVVASPVKVDYVVGDTIATALNKTGHTFEGLEDSMVISVNGVAGNYGRASSNPVEGALERLDATPETLAEKLVVFKADEESFEVSDSFALLAIEVVRYEGSEEAKRYSAASNLYNGIMDDFPRAMSDDTMASELYQALKRAIDAAEGQYEGTPLLVEVQLFHGTEDLEAEDAHVIFTNEFGTPFRADASEEIQLLPGNYTFAASIPALGKEATGAFSVELPEADQDGGDLDAQRFELVFPADDYWVKGACFGVTSSTPTVQYNPVSSLSFDLHVMDNSTSTIAYAGIEWSDAALRFGASYRSVIVTYEQTNGNGIKEQQISNSSTAQRPSTAIRDFIPSDGSGRSVDYVATLHDFGNNVMFRQKYTFNLVRPRTLASLKIEQESGFAPVDPAFSPNTYVYTAKVLDSNEFIKIWPTAFSSYESGYRVYVNDELAEEGQAAEIMLKGAGEEQDAITVQVRHMDGTVSEEYIVTPELLPAVTYSFNIPKEATIEVRNSVENIEEFSNLNRQNPDYNTYSFDLAQGLTYNYTVTQGSYFTTSGSFIAVEGGEKSVTVDTNDYIDSIEMRRNASSDIYCGIASGDEISHELTGTLKDYYTTTTMKVSLQSGVTGRTIHANYLNQTTAVSSNQTPRTLTLKDGTNTTLAQFTAAGGRAQKLELIVRQVDGEFTREQIYNITIDRELYLHLSHVPEFISEGLLSVYTPAFDRDVREGYEVIVVDDAQELVVKAAQNGTIPSEDIDQPYVMTVNGVATEPAADYTTNLAVREVTLPLSGTKEDEEVRIQLTHPSGARGEYTFLIKKAEPVDMTFELTPEDALLTLFNEGDMRIWPNEEGVYSLLAGRPYTYALSKSGYVAGTGSFVADVDVTSMELAIELAEPNEDIDPDRDIEWNKFRGDDNTGVTKIGTPTSAEDSQLYWAYKSSGMSHVGQPLMLDNYVAIFTGNKLQYLDNVSGELLAEGIMFSAGGVIPTYSDGMVFCPVTGGLQAFNAKPRPQTESDVGYTNKEVMVLDSLWVYSDPIGGGGFAPFYVEDGYIYGGWQQVKRPGAFVCLSITDEDPSQTHEVKTPTWRWIRGEGFYWAGAHIGERFVVVGGEAAVTEDHITCLDVRTGEVLDTLQNVFNSENRGSVVYDKESDRYCLVTKDSFYSVRVDDNGKFYDLKVSPIGGMSTSTPAIYNGRAYIGVSGNGQFQSFTGSGIMVLDVVTSEPIYAMSTRGYPQSSGLISTAYSDVPHYNPQTGKEETGFVYVYFTHNDSTGSISFIIDKPGVTEPVLSDNVGGVKVAPVLFHPQGHHTNYNLASLQVDRYGTLYMKTDRAYIMAIGHRIEGIELQQEPDRTVYRPGEEFDRTGMKVIAKYSNGLERDISGYVSVENPVLVAEQTSINVRFPYALYNNNTASEYIDSKENSTFDKLPRPEVSVPLVVLNEEQALSIDEVIGLIDDIGTVEFDGASNSRISNARNAYNASDPVIRKAVSNYQMLLEAEERYSLLTLASQNK
ncbi:MAG: cadherin-like beta sandwich domain-containing protein, partial [Christensenellales bacterium]